MSIDPTQAFCVTPGCACLVWNPTMTAEDNLACATVADLDGK